MSLSNGYAVTQASSVHLGQLLLCENGGQPFDGRREAFASEAVGGSFTGK
jgi:hypothetical protein